MNTTSTDLYGLLHATDPERRMYIAGRLEDAAHEAAATLAALLTSYLAACADCEGARADPQLTHRAGYALADLGGLEAELHSERIRLRPALDPSELQASVATAAAALELAGS
jgi:hypothetical protein